MVKWLGLRNNVLALILPYLISGWFVLLMKGFLQTIPEAIIESAKMDGAGELRIFAQIVLQISKPALATLGLFFALQYWNDWWLTLLYMDQDHLMKLQYLLIRVLKNMEYLNSSEAIQYGLVKPGTQVPSLSARMAMCGYVYFGSRTHASRFSAVSEIFCARIDGRFCKRLNKSRCRLPALYLSIIEERSYKGGHPSERSKSQSCKMDWIRNICLTGDNNCY
ncbi:ABC transporter permease subunit [Paenibacillus sp. HWE-109]|nr:ABC transporter permease subunit [Paenibacillus sp. HWE-109]